MSTPRRPYARLLLGCVDDVVALGVSKLAALLLALLLTHRAKRSIPGLIPLGPSGLAESLSGWTDSEVKRALNELQRHELVVTDFKARPPLIFVVGALYADPPATENGVRGMAIQWCETPACDVRRKVHQEATKALSGSSWMGKWLEWTTSPDDRPEALPSSRPDSGRESSPLRDPIPNTDPTAAAAIRAIWDRLPKPFDAAADQDFLQISSLITVEDFGKIADHLSPSAFTTTPPRMNTPPSVRRLIESALKGDGYWQKLANVGYPASDATPHRCAVCDEPHVPSQACAGEQPCGRRHQPGASCRRCKDIREDERRVTEEAKLAAWQNPETGGNFEDLKREYGIVKAFQIKDALDAKHQTRGTVR